MKFYIPISIGNPKFCSANVKKVANYLQMKDASLTIVLFDSLRVLTNVIKGDDYLEAERKAEVTTVDTQRMLYKIFEGYQNDVEILRSARLAKDVNVSRIRRMVVRYLESNKEAFALVNARSYNVLRRMGLEKTAYRMFLEQQYIIEETSVSLSILTNKKIKSELYIKKESGLIDYIFENPSDFSDESILANGRRFLSWPEVGIEC